MSYTRTAEHADRAAELAASARHHAADDDHVTRALADAVHEIAKAIAELAGTGLTFGMWWVYFVVPSSHLLDAQRSKSIPYGYGHIVVFGSIVATGAGLHAAAYYIEQHSKLGSVGTVLSVAIPVGIYIGSAFLLYILRWADGKVSTHRCRSIPTNWFPSYSHIGASYVVLDVTPPASAGNPRGAEAPPLHHIRSPGDSTPSSATIRRRRGRSPRRRRRCPDSSRSTRCGIWSPASTASFPQTPWRRGPSSTPTTRTATACRTPSVSGPPLGR